MAESDRNQITALLDGVRRGDRNAIDQLIEMVYPELRSIAAHYLRSERPDHTLQATALAHETYARLFGSKRTDWKTRAHFFAVAARGMWWILVDRSEERRVGK